MELTAYKKKILPLMATCALFNVGIILSLNYLEFSGMGRAYFAFLVLNLIVSVFFLTRNAKLINLRFQYLIKNKEYRYINLILYLFALHAPLWGMYVLYKTFQNAEPSTLVLRKIIFFRFIPIVFITILLVCFIPYAKYSLNSPIRILDTLTPAIENYSIDTSSQGKMIFDFKDNVTMYCTDDFTRPDCVLNWIRQKHNNSALNTTGIVLSIAIDAMEIFKYKNKFSKNKVSNILVAKMAIKHNVELLRMNCSRAKPIWNYGIPITSFLIGNLELSLIEIVEEIIHRKLFNVAFSSLWKIAENGKKNANMDESLKILTELKSSNCYKSTEY
jgi:hypothetical protein